MRKFIAFLLKLIIIICSFIIIYRLFFYFKDSKTYTDIQYLKPTISDSITISDTLSSINSENISPLDINDDYKFWLNIPNTNIDYPVVQGSNNTFYLDHDFNKKTSISGCLFIDSRNTLASDKNLIIYGHNMNNKSMFNNLNKFKDEEFFSNNSTIEILEDDTINTYEIFSVYTSTTDELELKFLFKDNEDYSIYLNTLLNKSLIPKTFDFNLDSPMITLITCSYEYLHARTIVHAIKKS